jgi:hypothetical protein
MGGPPAPEGLVWLCVGLALAAAVTAVAVGGALLRVSRRLGELEDQLRAAPPGRHAAPQAPPPLDLPRRKPGPPGSGPPIRALPPPSR